MSWLRKPGEFTFPVIPETASAKGWILPFFEGVYAPCGDAKWVSFLTNRGELNTTADLTMPFLGLDYGRATLTCILTNPFNNRLEFRRAPDKALQARLTHQFTRNHPVKEYGVIFELPRREQTRWSSPPGFTGSGLSSGASSSASKTRSGRRPRPGSCSGAAHAYLWGHELLTQADVTDWKKFARDLKAQGEAPAASPGQADLVPDEAGGQGLCGQTHSSRMAG